MKYNRFESLKVLAHTDKIMEIREGNIPSPVEWIVYPSNKCPYDCKHCIMKDERAENQTMLSSDTMDKIVKDVKQYKIKTVIFSGGGEPLTNPHTVRTAEDLKASGVSVGINTNGIKLTDRSAFDFVRISVDAASRETYNAVKGYDGWEILNKNLAEISKQDGTLGLAFLITPDNIDEILEFCIWAKQYNPDFIHIRPAYYKDNGLKNSLPYILKIKETVEKEFPEVFFRIDKFEGHWTPKLFDKCRSTPLMAVLAADGSFVVCQDVFIRFGDYNEQSFEECWWGDSHKEALEEIDIKNCPRCVENTYNEVIQHIDKMEVNLL